MYDKTSGSSQLHKFKLNSFDGNLLEVPEGSCIFVATVHRRNTTDSEEKSHLKTHISGKTKSAIYGLGYSGSFYTQVSSLLERKFGRPHLIVDTLLETLGK